MRPRARFDRLRSTRSTSSRSRRLLAGVGAVGLVAGLSAAVTAGAVPASAAVNTSSDPITYGYTGAVTTVTVPQNVQMAFVQVTGGSGGDASKGAKGGMGAVVDGAFYVTPGEQLEIAAAQGGLTGAPGWGPQDYIGGAPGTSGWSDGAGPVDAGGGGGASAVFTPSGPAVIAGGGGGAGASAHDSEQYPSEPAGGDGGSAGATPANGATGAGGTADGAGAGGAGGGSSSHSGGTGAAAVTVPAYDGTFGQGGGGGGGADLGGAGGGVGGGDAGFGGGGGGGAGQSWHAPAVFDDSIATASAAGDGSVVLYWISGTQLNATPLPAVVTASSTPHPLAVSATDASGESLPDPSAFVTWSSSNPTDVFDAAGVVMTKVGTRTITATWNGDPSTSSSFQVQVTEGALVGFTFVDPAPADRTVAAGTQVMFAVEGVDAFGNYHGDATEDVTYSSSVASDVFSTSDPNEVTVTAPGQHVFTASYPGYTSATVTITVTAGSQRVDTTPPPAGGGQGSSGSGTSGSGGGSGTSAGGAPAGDPAPTAASLAVTGGSAPLGFLIMGLATVIVGISLSMIVRLRRPIRRRSRV
jgi:hypothetical protein